MQCKSNVRVRASARVMQNRTVRVSSGISYLRIQQSRVKCSEVMYIVVWHVWCVVSHSYQESVTSTLSCSNVFLLTSLSLSLFFILYSPPTYITVQ